jgi:GNAT superfamily N-acetyltransferase
VLVVLRGNAVVGVVDVVIVPSLLDGVVPHAIVDALVVDDEVRGEGIGRALPTAPG